MSYFICLDCTKEIKERQRIKSSHKGEECIFLKTKNRLFFKVPQYLGNFRIVKAVVCPTRVSRYSVRKTE